MSSDETQARLRACLVRWRGRRAVRSGGYPTGLRSSEWHSWFRLVSQSDPWSAIVSATDQASAPATNGLQDVQTVAVEGLLCLDVVGGVRRPGRSGPGKVGAGGLFEVGVGDQSGQVDS